MGRPTSGRRSASSTPGHPALHRRRCEGKAATGFQWGRPEPGCSGNTSPLDAGTINHQGAAYPGRAQESPGGCRGPKAPPPKGRATLRSIAPRLPDSCGKPRSTPGARATQRLRPRVASATSTITATAETTLTRRCAGATTQGLGDATTAGRIGVPRPNHLVRRLSAGPYDGRRSRPGSEPRLLSQSTRGRRGRNLPLFLSDTARAWLEHLPPGQISNWDDLVQAFVGNFQGTYVHPGNSWDLRSCRQQPGESLRDYIRRFSKQRTELPNVTDSDVIGAFLADTTCHDLVSKLGRKTPTRASELMDIATKFASGQEAVEAIFRKDKQP
jgi:hypothetical protein